MTTVWGLNVEFKKIVVVHGFFSYSDAVSHASDFTNTHKEIKNIA